MIDVLIKARRILATLTLFTALTGAAAGQGLLYECEITDRREDVGWISPQYVVVIDGQGAVSVVDSVILVFNDAPMVPSRVRRKGDELRIFYSLRVTDASKLSASMAYSVFLDTAAKTIKLRARSTQGGSVSWRGSGSCKTRSK